MSEEIQKEEITPIIAEETPVDAPSEDVAPVVVEEAPAVVEPVEEATLEPVIEERKVDAEPVAESVQGVGVTNTGAIGTVVTPKPAKKAPAKKAAKKDETVAVYSTRNVTWAEVGKVYRGYNIVSKEAAEKWLKRDHVRLATPEEVAREYGK